MDRGASSQLLSWMIWPVCAVLAFAALTLPRQPYTGLMLRGDWVARIDPASPGELAGIRPGDRLLRDPALSAGPENPLAGAQPGIPLPLLREHAGNIDDVTIVPAPLPAEERRVMAMLLAVASGFMVLGGWLWSERRDRMTRAFFLMCLSFACLIAPFPRFRSPAAMLAYETLYSGITLFLPALLVHFFALFPDSTRLRGMLTRIVRIAYGVSAGLFAIEVLLAVAPLFARHMLDPVQELLQSMAALWFGLGTLVAIALFVRSYVLARREDTRRRLRVALAGTVLGFLPLASLVLLRNLFPGVSVPAERGAVMLTLLVPASFAWAAGVYRVFEVRMAMRAAVVLGFLLVMSAVVFSLGEWLAGAWRPDLGHGIAGGALAFVVVISAMAGPAARALRDLGERMVPDVRERSPFAILESRAEPRLASADALYAAACETIAEWLRLDGCAALDLAGNPEGVLADEPTSNLDTESGKTLVAVFQELHGKGKTVLLASHDPAVVSLASRVLMVAGGKLRT
ncbi:MAG: hypothetical protein ACRENS_08400, partial [Candidatus Eiseniibacteriota bacterium]